MFERNVFVMAGGGLGCRRKNGFRQAIGFAQSRGQLNAADFSSDAIVFPARARNVAAHNAFNGQWLRLAHDHGTACEFVRKVVEGRRKIGRAEDVVWNNVPQQIKPEERELREDAAFVRDRSGKNYVESGEPVRSDDQQLVAEIIDVTDLTARGGGQARELRLPDDFHGRNR